jgi:hypothetical protein
MDASETAKDPKSELRKRDAREDRLAQALRANLIRRKAHGATPASKAPVAGRD